MNRRVIYYVIEMENNMKKIMRKVLCVTLTLTLCMIFCTAVFADTSSNLDDSEMPTSGVEIPTEENITPRMDGYYTWDITSKGDNTETYGGWYEGVRKYTDGTSKGTISCSLNVSVSHSYTGSLQVSIAKLSSYLSLQHTIGVSWSRTVESSESFAGLSKGTYAIMYRRVYNSQPVTQTKYYHIDGYKSKVGTSTVTVKKFKSIEYDFIKLSSSKL